MMATLADSALSLAAENYSELCFPEDEPPVQPGGLLRRKATGSETLE